MTKKDLMEILADTLYAIQVVDRIHFRDNMNAEDIGYNAGLQQAERRLQNAMQILTDRITK